ncbi:hypothetical protein OAV94_01985 [Candidatus Pelagibacter sp.]|nr:hypothetical protein [Candidatus Pelagibacter sp.]
MNLFDNLKLSLKALNHENELSISYLIGTHTELPKSLIDRKKNFEGIFFRILSFLRILFVNFTLKSSKKNVKNLLIFVSTKNQLDSLNPVIQSLKKNKVSFELILDVGNFVKLNKNFGRYEKVLFSPKIVIIALILFIRRFPNLYYNLKKQKKKIAIKKYFNLFCNVYAYIPYFLQIIKKNKTKFILSSNDHNSSNRSLRLAAEMMSIKTIYLQHASVTKYLPPLEFDYALLDGKKAEEGYINNFKNLKNKNARVKNNTKKCKIILSGQKKNIFSKKISKSYNLSAGIAVNNFDEFEKLEKLVKKILTVEENCIIRTHPGQYLLFKERLNKLTKFNKKILLSNSNNESISSFFSKVKYILSGNSSIHLEASLAGIPTFFYQMNKNKLVDNYEYIKNGVSFFLGNRYNIKLIKKGIKYSKSKLRYQVLKKYSETFDTIWFNNEGHLTSIIIKKLLKNDSFDDIFKLKSSKYFYSKMILK